MQFTSQILTKYRLTPEEKAGFESRIKNKIKKIDTSLKKHKIAAKVFLGGSAAKGTTLKGDFDVDIFVRFSPKYKNQNISELLGKAIKQFSPKRLHGSRDYYQIHDKGLNYEIVPVIDIKNPKDAQNVTDASPLHVQWVKAKTRKNPKLIDEIILTKVFLKANRLYGAESYIGGFSGHVVDILVINCGGFINLLKAASKWTAYILIDPEKHHKGKKLSLNQSKLGPLILIDPIQPDRNAAAAINQQTFERFIEIAKLYLKHPSLSFFEKQEFSIPELKQKAGQNKLFILSLRLKKAKTDVNGAKIVKLYRYLTAKLTDNDFVIVDKGWEWDKSPKSIIWFIIDSKPLERTKIHPGPPVTERQEHIRKFRRLYKNTFVRDAKFYAKINRKYTEPKKLLNDSLKDPYVLEKVKEIRLK